MGHERTFRPWVVVILHLSDLDVNVLGYRTEDDAIVAAAELLGIPLDEAEEDGEWFVDPDVDELRVKILQIEYPVQ